MGYVGGRSDGNSYPEDAVTRAELAALPSKSFASETYATEEYDGADAEGHWGEPYSATLEEVGAISKYSEGCCDPDTEATNQEFVDAISAFIEFPENRYLDSEWVSEFGGGWYYSRNGLGSIT